METPMPKNGVFHQEASRSERPEPGSNQSPDQTVQVTYVAVRPDGTIMGPSGPQDFVMEALVIGYIRTHGGTNTLADIINKADSSDVSTIDIFNHIISLGYSIRKAEIRLLPKD